MGVDAKHAYRFGFLKSEHWQWIRKSALARKEARCEVCHRQDWSNDIHHARYRGDIRKPWWSDLHVLCRICHEIVHFIIDHREKMGARKHQRRHWKNIHRSAKRIVKMARKVGSLEIAMTRTGSIYRELEFAHASAKDRIPVSVESSKGSEGRSRHKPEA